MAISKYPLIADFWMQMAIDSHGWRHKKEENSDSDLQRQYATKLQPEQAGRQLQRAGEWRERIEPSWTGPFAWTINFQNKMVERLQLITSSYGRLNCPIANES